MNLEAQRYLADLVAFMRQARGLPTGREDPANTALAHFGTTLRALKAVGAVTHEEFDDWMSRARDASGWDPAAELRRRVAREGDVRPTKPPDSDRPLPRFLRLVPAPNEEYDFHGGRLRIIGVELYDIQMALHWRMAPAPDLDAALPEAAAAAEADTEGLPEQERAQFRRRRQSHSWHVLGSFQVTDDAGNTYASHGSWGAAGNIMTGRLDLTPALQEGASALVVDALGLRITVPVADPGA